MIRLVLFFSLILSQVVAFAQKDSLVDIGSNNKIIEQRRLQQNVSANRYYSDSNKKKASLSLPFLDDFSQYHFYPDGSKWADVNVFINTNYAVNPISYGVATFDGLDSTGYPYNFINPTSYGIADYLTSKPIDLTTVVDSVYLSFYYQPKGMGNQPEAKDSLRLEFFRKSDSTWVRKWAVPGAALAPFKLVMIPVDVQFQSDSFQFRFKNYATLSGNVDHWNVDYVYLNDNRTFSDTTLNDVALTRNYYNMLNGYSAMPWTHYMVDTLNNMSSVINVEYRNNHNSTYSVFYEYNVITDNGAGAVIESYPTSTSFKPVNGYSSLVEPQAVYSSPLNNFYFPTDDTAKTKVFQLKNFFNISSGAVTDFNIKNDTVVSYQVFSNYYSYDDGSAEAGYGIEGVGAKLANQFTIKKSDTLVGIRIYFNPVTYNHSNKSFKLKIWSSLNPEVLIYEQVDYYNPVYSFTNEFLNYNLTTPILLPAGTYYFGYENITSDFLTLGYDLNTNSKYNIFFNAEGIWQNSNYDGSLMLHPLFKYNDAIIGVDEVENEKSSIKIYPNPSQGIFYVKTSQAIEAHVYDLLGNLVAHFPKQRHTSFNLNSLTNGVYFIHLTGEKNNLVEKIIISK
ncbi:MAG: T9SS type A sorting domain-containing protein [Flavobacteriales bacterium]|nr:T9SS type A sorting domain-containing protein [Flavobacteriales bacterium]